MLATKGVCPVLTLTQFVDGGELFLHMVADVISQIKDIVLHPVLQ